MKGLAYQWLFILIGGAVLTLLFVLLSEGYSPINSYAQENILSTDGIPYTIYLIVDTLWRYFPVILLFLILIYAITQSQKRNIDEGGF